LTIEGIEPLNILLTSIDEFFFVLFLEIWLDQLSILIEFDQILLVVLD